MKRTRDRGVALLTVLMLVAVMSVLAVGVLDDIRFAIRRTTNAEALGQARWYALGAEALARTRLGALGGEESAAGPDSNLTTQPVSYPVENGAVALRIADGGACFNLNSLVQGEEGAYARSDIGVREFQALAVAIGAGEGQAGSVASAVVDRIGGGQGAGGGVLLAEPSELRALPAVTPQFYAQLRPFLCALPTTELSPINVNAVAREQTPLIAMLGGGKVSREDAARIVAARPPGGWTDLEAFWNAFTALDVSPDEPVRAQARLRGRFYAVESQATYGDAEVVATSLLERQQDGAVRLVARRWGRAE